jgi:hypothetical protein
MNVCPGQIKLLIDSPKKDISLLDFAFLNSYEIFSKSFLIMF